MPPIPIGLVRPDSADCDRNWQVDPNCPQPSDQDTNVDNKKVVPVPFDWDDLDDNTNEATSTTEAAKVVTKEMTKKVIKKITERILTATRKATETGVAQDDMSGTGYQVFHDDNETQDNNEDSFSVIMTVGGFVVSVVIVGSVGNI